MMSEKGDRTRNIPKDELQRRILHAVRDALAQEIVPAIHSEKAVTTAHLLLRLLDFVNEDERPTAPSLAGRNGLPQNLTEELRVLSGQEAAIPQNDLDAIGASLVNILVRAEGTGAARPEAAFLRKLLAHETQSLRTLDFNGEHGVDATYAKGIVKVVPAESDVPGLEPLREPKLTEIVRASGLFGPTPKIVAITEIPGGFNKITAGFAVVHDGVRDELIMRRNALPNPTGFSVVDEFPLLKSVWKAGGVPIAEPLMLESDPAVLGSPFIVVRRMPGSTNVDNWRDDAQRGRTLAQELARALARLHCIDVATFMPPGERIRPTHEYVAEEVDRWHQRSLRWRVRPSPAIDAGFAWMRNNLPLSDRKPVLVHGDVGFHNMLMEDGRLTALLDWEFAHIGDPMEDLNYCRPFVANVCDWEVFMETYRDAGGVPFDSGCEGFFRLWPSLRNGSGCDALMRCFLEHPGSDIKFAVAGTQHVRRYENAILEILAGKPE